MNKSPTFWALTAVLAFARGSLAKSSRSRCTLPEVDVLVSFPFEGVALASPKPDELFLTESLPLAGPPSEPVVVLVPFPEGSAAPA